ncbi:nucleotidyltransferase [Nicoliella lavandulae]|uniref:tRNA(Met) cytidine acetate ligase n=1 Tax=Nicoliella lavandulae TaxID=3082954 RepID=A0ABU8SKT4_9LACO
MLSAVGIIAEYNPFHNGHAYQLQLAKQRTNADVVVAVMSGNWVQRGAPAIVDKWVRTEMALAMGVDLVVELPVFDAVQPADLFARGAVRIVDQLQCDSLAFGCEHADYDFAQLGRIAVDDDQAHFRDYQQPYPALIQAAINEQFGININQPNDILALNYAQAVHQLDSKMQLVPIERVGSRHHDADFNGALASASAIRKAILSRSIKTVQPYLPAPVYSLLQNHNYLDLSAFWSIIRYQLVMTPLDELNQRYQMTEGLEYRLKEAAIKHAKFKEFMSAIKTKRYTYSRLQRLLVYVLLQANQDDFIHHDPYLRVLGFNPTGQQYLNQVKSQIDWPIISKIDQSMLKSVIKTEFNAGMLIQMKNGQYQDLYRHPIIKK